MKRADLIAPAILLAEQASCWIRATSIAGDGKDFRTIRLRRLCSSIGATVSSRHEKLVQPELAETLQINGRRRRLLQGLVGERHRGFEPGWQGPVTQGDLDSYKTAWRACGM
jgi:hypothetical protein